ncbi:hypothetical protein [Pseudorhodobacter aquimaris]|uniref:hypothetical protein n=1 Tax=Pseudorhodobacter aquimaris TaxID=687412 RepID=UPI000A82B671|nr:hypothetical protein [Pseudorhodobacter aquimaris]
MPAPIQDRPMRPDTEVIRIPNLSDWLSFAALGDSALWANYVDHRTIRSEGQK